MAKTKYVHVLMNFQRYQDEKKLRRRSLGVLSMIQRVIFEELKLVNTCGLTDDSDKLITWPKMAAFFQLPLDALIKKSISTRE